MKWFSLVTALVLWSGAGFAAETWNIDDTHAAAHFTVKHLMISNVPGQFTGMKGKFVLDEKDMTKMQIDATIDAKTINTNNTKRDDHLRNADFFDVKKFPTLGFKSKKISKEGSGFKIVGDLTMKGVTKEVTLQSELTPAMKDPWGNTRRGFSATGSLNRKDWGLVYNTVLETGGVAISEEVKLQIDVELIAEKKAEAKKS